MAVPNAPTNLVVTATAVGELYLTWEAPVAGDAPTGYKVYSGTTTGVLTLLDTLGTVLVYTHESLGNGVTRFYQVKAFNLDGDSATGTDEESATTWSLPGVPTSLATVDGDASAVLTWVAPVNTGGTTLTGYKVYRGTVSGSLSLITTLGVVLTYTDTGLTNDTTYYYTVAATNAVGTGTQTAEVTAEPGASSVVLKNKDHRACGALSIQVYELSNGHSWTLTNIYTNKNVVGISAAFSSDDNLSSTLSIVTSTANKTVKVYDGSSESSNLFDVIAVVYYI